VTIAKRSKTLLKKLIFGNTLLPQEFFVGLVEPQREVSVWLQSNGQNMDITCRHSIACAAPFAVCIAFEKGRAPEGEHAKEMLLSIRETEHPGHRLGEISLRATSVIRLDGLDIMLCEATWSRNFCLPRLRLASHYLFQELSQRKARSRSEMNMSALERRASMVMFIRPHPVSLGSVSGPEGGNIFPMNLMGEIGSGHFAFALRRSRQASHLIEQNGRFALSSVPISKGRVAHQLAINHTKQSIQWKDLPFQTTESATFGIPVPDFALRVREMRVETIRRIGSHTLFIAQVIDDKRIAFGPELCAIHGFYQARRLRREAAKLQEAVMADALIKQR
jgi:flavin reductase (DIM6/NTAB) family NADH-FMN oxidoreductase RutF